MALVAAGVLVLALAGNIGGAGSVAVTPVASTPAEVQAPKVPQFPEVELATKSSFLDTLWTVFDTGSDRPHRVADAVLTAPAAAHGGLSDFTLAVVPELLPDTLSGEDRYVIAEALNLAASPLTNLLTGGLLGRLLSPILALGTSLSNVAGHLAGDTPSPLAALREVLGMPGAAIGGYRSGASLDLSGLAPALVDRGILSEDVDPDALHIDFGGRATAPPGRISGLVHDIARGLLLP